MQKKKGISLIVLVITIIVMIVLAGAIVLTLSNSGIINKSSEAVFKQNVRNYQTELSLYLSEELMKSPTMNIMTVNITGNSIKEIIASISDEDLMKFEITFGKLKYIGTEEDEKKWAEELGIKTGNEALTEEEYNILYADEIALALKYGQVIDGAYSLKPEYTPTTLPTSVTKLAIPYGTIKIEYNTFYECNTLDEVVLPEGLENVGESAFYGSSIKEISFPSTLKIIDSSAFGECNNLTSIIIPKGVELYLSAFYGCNSLREVELLGKNGLGGETFSENIKLEKITLGEGIEYVTGSTFNGCISLKEITLPKSLRGIGEGAFCGCTNLEEVIIQEGLQYISDGSFAGCAIKQIILPSTLENISYCAFENCSQLKSIYIKSETCVLIEEAFNGVPSDATIYVKNDEIETAVKNAGFTGTIVNNTTWVAPEN